MILVCSGVLIAFWFMEYRVSKVPTTAEGAQNGRRGGRTARKLFLRTMSKSGIERVRCIRCAEFP